MITVRSFYYPGSSASGTNWTNPTNVFASDNARATYANAGQNDLFITGFGFAIPTGATIIGIEVEVEGNGASGTAANRSIGIGATKDGSTLAGSRLATQNLPQTTDGILTFGNSTNLFSTTFTPAEINASTFGIMLRAGNTNTSQRSIDRVRVRIYFQPPTGNTSASDNFNRANGGMGQNWGDCVHAEFPTIVSNQIVAASFTDHCAIWIADTFDDDQYSEAKLTAIDGDSNSYLGVLVHASPTDFVVGQQVEDFNGCAIVWYNGGANTIIAQDAAGLLSANDVLRLEVEGTEYRLYVNDVLRLSGTNGSAPTTGQPGVLVSNDGDAEDDWEGGNFVAAGSTFTPRAIMM